MLGGQGPSGCRHLLYLLGRLQGKLGNGQCCAREDVGPKRHSWTETGVGPGRTLAKGRSAFQRQPLTRTAGLVGLGSVQHPALNGKHSALPSAGTSGLQGLGGQGRATSGQHVEAGETQSPRPRPDYLTQAPAPKEWVFPLKIRLSERQSYSKRTRKFDLPVFSCCFTTQMAPTARPGPNQSQRHHPGLLRRGMAPGSWVISAIFPGTLPGSKIRNGAARI